MPHFDLPTPELRSYRAPDIRPPDFDEYWSAALAEAAGHPLNATFTPVDSGYVAVRTFDVSFVGAEGARVAGWLHLPAFAEGPYPAVVEYLGYAGNRGLPHQRIEYAAAGYAHFIMDTRGQGPDTADPAEDDGAPQWGIVTRGLLDPARSYYKRVFVDAVRALDTIAAHEEIDASRVAVAGVSQGGGISIAAASLSDIPSLALVDVPFLCHFSRAVRLTDADPYGSISRYLARYPGRADAAFETLSYVDGVHHAGRADAPVLMSVGLMDPVCPPSTAFAAFNNWRGSDREMVEYPFSGHEGGDQLQLRRRLDWLAQRWGDR